MDSLLYWFLTRHPIVKVSIAIAFLFTLCFVPTMFLTRLIAAYSEPEISSKALPTRAIAAQVDQPTLRSSHADPLATLPPTNTPVRQRPAQPEGDLTIVSSGPCSGAVEDYIDEIVGPVSLFGEIAQLSYETTTGEELAVVIVALDEPWKEFQAIPVPSCAVNQANLILLGMEEIILALGDFVLGETDANEAAARVHSGGYKILDGLEQLDTLASTSGSIAFNSEAAPPQPQPTRTLPPTATPIPPPLASGSAIYIDDGISQWDVWVERIDYPQSIDIVIGGELIQQYLPEQRFVVLFLSATNRGRQTDFFFPYALTIRDAHDSTYNHDEAITEAAESFVYELDALSSQAHPGQTGHTIAVFDLPAGKGPYVLTRDRLYGPPQEVVLLNVN